MATAAQNHNPYAQNGFDSAWNILSPIWGGENITPLATYFNGTQGWLHYTVQGLGDVVDRYRWQDGCIVEHVSSRIPAECNAKLTVLVVGSRGEVSQRNHHHFYRSHHHSNVKQEASMKVKGFGLKA
jgi:hypothetical protein